MSDRPIIDLSAEGIGCGAVILAIIIMMGAVGIANAVFQPHDCPSASAKT